MTTEQKIGQFFFPAVFINDTEENIQETERLIREHHIGGLTFFHSRASAATNYETKQKVIFNDDSFLRLKERIVRFQKCASTPLLMSIDAEWGLAMRVEKTPQYPYAITLGALPENKINLVYELGKQIGLDLKSAGIHYNLAPLADLNNNPNNPVIGYRSFGQNKEKVARFALEYCRGLSDVGILSCLKHFPGHGNTSVDSHLGLPILEENLEQLLENELYPFIKGIENKVDSIMIGHLAVPALNDGKNTSATLSKSIIEALLRKQLGFEGLVISDALNMRSVSSLYSEKGQLEWEAFNAGNDVLCFAENVVEGIEKIKENGTLERIEASYNRILKCKQKAGLFQNLDSKITETADFDFKETARLNMEIAKNSLSKTKNMDATQIVFNAHKKTSLAKISIYKKVENPFFKALCSDLDSAAFEIEMGNTFSILDLEEKTANFDTLIIALFVPKAKPLNKFDIEEPVLEFLSQIFETKKCIFYIFGNPYSTEVIPNLSSASEIFQVYQDFPEFQENAAQQLLSGFECEGTVPVKISIQ